MNDQAFLNFGTSRASGVLVAQIVALAVLLVIVVASTVDGWLAQRARDHRARDLRDRRARLRAADRTARDVSGLPELRPSVAGHSDVLTR